MSEDSLFDWDQANIRHLRRHKVSTSEFEEALLNDAIELEYEDEDGEPRFKSLGRTNDGRILVLVWTIRSERVRAITAYNAGPSLRRLWPRVN